MLLLLANFDLSTVSSQSISLGADGAAGDAADGAVLVAGGGSRAGTGRPSRRSAAQSAERHPLRTPGNEDRRRVCTFPMLAMVTS